MPLHRTFGDERFQQLVHLLERQLAKWLALMLMLVLLAATLQLTWVAALDLARPGKNWLGGGLVEFLDQLLLILIALELLQTVTAYLRDHAVQIELVLVTALTALSRKLIIHPPGTHSDGPDLLMVGLAVVCLSGSYWLVRESHRGQGPNRRGPARAFPADHPSPEPDGADGEGSAPYPRG